jgi:hypothetical protein
LEMKNTKKESTVDDDDIEIINEDDWFFNKLIEFLKLIISFIIS